MATLNTLPPEILHAIILEVPNSSLPAIARVSRNLYQSANTELYRSIYFKASDHDYFSKGLGNYYQSVSRAQGGSFGGQLQQTTRSTKILSIDQCLQTFRESKELCCKVNIATFHWTPAYNSVVANVLELLGPSTCRLQLSPRLCNLQLANISHMHVTSLEIQFAELKTNSGGRFRKAIYTVFSIPTLESLSLAGISSWSWPEESEHHDRSRTSNITCLSFPNGVVAGNGLVEMLSWPKALKSFSLDLVPHYSSKNDFFRFGDGPNDVWPLRFPDALNPQRNSLEVLLISGRSSITDLEFVAPVNLRGFSRLRMLGLPREFLVMTKKLKAYGARPGSSVHSRNSIVAPRCLPMFENLPASLEELHIEFWRGNDWHRYFSAATTPKEQMTTGAPGEVSDWICDVARNKPTWTSALRKIGLWQAHAPWELGCVSLEGVPGCEKMLATCRAAEIEVSYVLAQDSGHWFEDERLHTGDIHIDRETERRFRRL